MHRSEQYAFEKCLSLFLASFRLKNTNDIDLKSEITMVQQNFDVFPNF